MTAKHEQFTYVVYHPAETGSEHYEIHGANAGLAKTALQMLADRHTDFDDSARDQFVHRLIGSSVIDVVNKGLILALLDQPALWSLEEQELKAISQRYIHDELSVSKFYKEIKDNKGRAIVSALDTMMTTINSSGQVIHLGEQHEKPTLDVLDNPGEWIDLDAIDVGDQTLTHLIVQYEVNPDGVPSDRDYEHLTLGYVENDDFMPVVTRLDRTKINSAKDDEG